MVKNRILSSLELLSLSKPRVTLILKEVIDNLIHIANNSNCENLRDFNLLCTQLRNNRINDISSFLSKNIIDYEINMNQHSDSTLVNIKFIFSNNFLIDRLDIKNLKL